MAFLLAPPAGDSILSPTPGTVSFKSSKIVLVKSLLGSQEATGGYNLDSLSQG